MLNFELVGLVFVILYAVNLLIRYRKKDVPIDQLVIHSFFFIYILGVLRVTLFPIPIDSRLIQETANSGIRSLHFNNNLIPFKTVYEVVISSLQLNYYQLAIRNIGGNLLLLAPLGIFVPIIWPSISGIRRLLLIGFISSLAIELAQFGISFILGFSYRSFDVDDLLLNTFGVIIGYKLYHFIVKRFPTQVRTALGYHHSTDY